MILEQLNKSSGLEVACLLSPFTFSALKMNLLRLNHKISILSINMFEKKKKYDLVLLDTTYVQYIDPILKQEKLDKLSPIFYLIHELESLSVRYLDSKYLQRIVLINKEGNFNLNNFLDEYANSLNYHNPDHIKPSNEKEQSFKKRNFIKELNIAIKIHMANRTVSVQQISKSLGISQDTLNRRIKKKFGMTSIQYILEYRLRFAKNMIEKNNISLTKVAENTAFSSYSYFVKKFKHQFGCLPSNNF